MSEGFEGFFAGLVLGSLLSIAICVITMDSGWKDDCIKRGHAEYNQTTGKWQWKELTKPGKPVGAENPLGAAQ